MKKVLGLDLGTTSIGWALVNEAENDNEKSSIIRLGVRVNPLTVDEQQNFEKGKSITTNADRTLKRSARRNLQRYKLRRENLIEILKNNGFISDDTILSENGNRSTFETYRLRAKAATEEISLEEFARVLLMINKKRGYKSSRKAKGSEDGALIDGMDVAKRLYNENLTPGQLCLQLLQDGKKYLPDFYRSDLQTEFDRIWEKQAEFYPEILTPALHEELRGKKRDAVYAICVKNFVWKEKHTEWSNEEARTIEVEKEHTIVGFKRNGNTNEQKIENLEWRVKGLSEQLQLEELVVVLQEINTKINGSSGYLGAISDRSKELFFNRVKKSDGTDRAQTVGEYQMAVLAENPNASLRNMVFYRQDYLDEFNTLWDTQAEFRRGEFNSPFTEDLKREICDVIIFYQRRLKSQKGLISFCEFESRQIEVEIDGKKKTKTVGSRVIPRSSPLFQEFKIWQILNNLEVTVNGQKGKRKKLKDNTPTLFDGIDGIDRLETNGRRPLDEDEKKIIAAELAIKEKLTKADILKLLFDNPKDLDLNFPSVQGNLTTATLYKAFQQIVEASGHELDLKKPAAEIIKDVEEIFSGLGYKSDFLQFNSDAENLDNEPMYKLWHLLYSFEGDNSNTGNEKLIERLASFLRKQESPELNEIEGELKEYAQMLANVTFQDDYGSLSAKAIRKILPHLKDGNQYDVAVEYAGYGKHSKASLTKEEIENKVIKDKLTILPKNTLRNPVVEKILNQMINVINTIIDTYGKPDEIRVELARELKKNAKEREELTKSVADNTKAHEEYKKILTKPLSEGGQFGLSRVSRTDIIRYKLWLELKATGFKSLYSGTFISPAKLFTGEFDIEHIIPQARLFDDSFSNKTLEKRDVNIKKVNKTAYDFVKEEYGEEGLAEYLNRVEMLYNIKVRTEANEEAKSAGTISKGKYNKLKMTESEIPDGFIERDLRNTQYIAKKSLEMLHEICRRVVATTGSITDELREDWQLIDTMKELNWDKYKALGLTEYIEVEDKNREGHFYKVGRIKDWTKRNDHRHHAMDALTVAFTKDVFIQYFNNKNASFKANSNEYAIKTKYFENGKAIPPMPLNEFRSEAKKYLENTLISIKAKNKVVTQNINATKKKGGTNKKVQFTPRGQLHLETVFGSIKQYVTKEEKIGTTFDEAKILTVSKPAYREALLKRLQQFDNDPKKAFGGKNAPAKNPIFINEARTEQLPEKVKTVGCETVYTIRKDISPDLRLDKVVDVGVRKVLESRLQEFGGDAKKAFSNLDENPIWLNKEKGISIKRVTITGISNAESLHDKKDKDGNFILDKDGKKQPVDFVNTGNNHHVAVYRVPILNKAGIQEEDENGSKKYELQENVVSFYEAVARRNQGLPVIDKSYKESEGWEFLFSMKQNEYFVFPNEKTGFNPQEIDLLNPDNYALISPNLFRVQKVATKDYFFRHHLETNVENNNTLKGITWIRSGLNGIENIVKVRVNHIGQIVSVGEY
ncbi:MAG: type II CRISPR RNA-guided endonuclease Cas9 [Culturomica sp.]|jgi:CRISPR-associated endonuclease Csn1|nr:type II CRISPR RNA-guided endonuclease Cas9 [Culturomica sp.]